MNFFGLMTFNAPYLPWVLLGFSLLLGNSISVDILGSYSFIHPGFCNWIKTRRVVFNGLRRFSNPFESNDFLCVWENYVELFQFVWLVWANLILYVWGSISICLIFDTNIYNFDWCLNHHDIQNNLSRYGNRPCLLLLRGYIP